MKEEVERAVGDKFVEWLNQTTGSKFQFDRIGANPPDLVYRDGDKTMPVEVSSAHYHGEDAVMLWKHARKDPTASTKWSKPLEEPDQKLITDVNRRIAQKCLSTHDAGTVLVIGIYPAITTKTDFEEVKSSIAIPSSNPFRAIYVAGSFGDTRDGADGYFGWKVS